MKNISNYLQIIDTDVDFLLDEHEIEPEHFLDLHCSLISVKEAKYQNRGLLLIVLSLVVYFMLLLNAYTLSFLQAFLIPFLGFGMGLTILINHYNLKKTIKNGECFQYLTTSIIKFYIPRSNNNVVIFTVKLFTDKEDYITIQQNIVDIKKMLMAKMYDPNYPRL